jgi:hypothetical protein
VDDFALTPAERTLLAALNRHGVRYLVVGLGAAVLQGAPVSTQDIDLWFEQPGDDAVRRALAEAGGFWIPAFGLQPPGLGGEGLDRLDTVLTAHGLDDFAAEYARALDLTVDGIAVKVLPLEREALDRPAEGSRSPAGARGDAACTRRRRLARVQAPDVTLAVVFPALVIWMNLFYDARRGAGRPVFGNRG